MIPSTQEIIALHKKYAPNDKVFELVYGHCQIVAEIAAWATPKAAQPVDTGLLQAASLLHDIGTYVYYDDDAQIANHRLYPLHAIFGAKIISDEGLDPRLSALVECHILHGLSKAEITDKPWPLPSRDYLQTTIEAELLGYADRFHTKQPVFNSYETFLARLKQDLPQQAVKFETLASKYGLPDIAALAQKYGHPIR